MKRAAIPFIALLLLGGFLIWWFQPAQVVKRRTNTLLELLTLDEGKGISSRRMGSYTLNSLLAEEVTLESPSIPEANGSFERHELESAYLALCKQAKFSRFTMVGIEAISIDGDDAHVDCTLDAVVELPSIRPADGRYECSFDWVRNDDGWRITRAAWDLVEE